MPPALARPASPGSPPSGDPEPGGRSTSAAALAGGVDRLRGAPSELRRQLREQKRVRVVVLAMVVALVLGIPMLYFGILFATRDPVLNSLDRLSLPAWAAQSTEDRIISGSRWCFIDCRLRERTLLSERAPAETTDVYQTALRQAGWTRWEVAGCPQVEVDGDYSCWTRDEYTLDLWVHPPECAYDPLNLRPEVEAEAPGEEAAGEEAEAGAGGQDPAGGADPQDSSPDGSAADPQDECSGSIVEIKIQNRVADERGFAGAGEQPGPDGELPGTPDPGVSGTADPSAPAPTATPTVTSTANG